MTTKCKKRKHSVTGNLDADTYLQSINNTSKKPRAFDNLQSNEVADPMTAAIRAEVARLRSFFLVDPK